MDQRQIPSLQGLLPQSAMMEGDDDMVVTYYHHRQHHQHSHHPRRSPRPDDATSDAQVLTSNTLLPSGMLQPPLKATAIMTADNILAAGVANKWNLSASSATTTTKQPVFGLINFEQTLQGVHVTGRIDGLGKRTSHGFHVHEFGDVSSGCTTAGAHFNPFRVPHGGLNDLERHVGDLGNVTADSHGVAHVNILNPLMSLYGESSIVGRAIVIHAMPDDLGRGGNVESMKTGNSGARLACGIIGLTKP